MTDISPRISKIVFSPLARKGFDTFLSMLGPVSVAGAHFLASAMLIPHLSAADYGVFAFALVLLQLANGFSDGLLGTPLAVSHAAEGESQVPVFSSVNWLYSLGFSFVAFFILISLTGVEASGTCAIFLAIMSFRWFGRSLMLVRGHRKKANWSDLSYASMLVGLLAVCYLTHNIYPLIVFAAMIVASAFSVLVLGGDFVRSQTNSFSFQAIKDFVPIWKTQAGWSILSVIANAATIEAHVFVVTFIAGPAVYAPIAIASLFFRPTLIGMYSIAQVERPKISKNFVQHGESNAKRATLEFLGINVVLWLGNCVAALLIAYYGTRFLDGKSYDIKLVQACVIAIGAVILVRVIRLPLITYLQAVGRFKSIAGITLYTAPVSIALAATGLYIGGALGSLVGLLLADIMYLSAVAYRFLVPSRL
jgi:hypothetical protein